MSLLWCDGSKHFGLGLGTDIKLAKKWTSSAGCSIQANGPNGGNCIKLGTLRKTLFNPQATGGSFATMFKMNVNAAGGENFGFGAGWAVSGLSIGHTLRQMFGFTLEADGIWSVFAGSTRVARLFEFPTHTNIWYTYEVNIEIFANEIAGVEYIAGVYLIRINKNLVAGNSFITDIPIDALAGTALGDFRPTSFSYTAANVGSTFVAFPVIYDEFETLPAMGNPTPYSLTSKLISGAPKMWAGDARILTVYPNADVVKQWSSTGANNYDQINEAGPADESNYVYSDTPGQIDVYDWDDIPPNLEILGIQHSIYAKKSDAGYRFIDHRCGDSGEETLNNIQIALGDDYYYIHQPRDSNPTDLTQFTPTTFNAKRFGQKLMS